MRFCTEMACSPLILPALYFAAGMFAALSAVGATAPANALTPSTSTTTARPPPSPPPTPPPSVPDTVNPFANESSTPKPLPRPRGLPERLTMDVVPERFDGLAVLQMILRGPDFEWAFDPLSDWVFAPAGRDESLAFTYRQDPSARLGFALWGPKNFLPGFTVAALIEYLAAIREPDPKGFVLLTAISPNASLLEPTSFAGFNAQAVRYATFTPTTVTLHHDWFINLHDEYLLVVTLTGPPALMDKFDAQVVFFFARSYVRKGLGIKEATATPAPAKAVEE